MQDVVAIKWRRKQQKKGDLYIEWRSSARADLLPTLASSRFKTCYPLLRRRSMQGCVRSVVYGFKSVHNRQFALTSSAI
jgi:hypothetical protein